jgi:hypothetical protein
MPLCACAGEIVTVDHITTFGPGLASCSKQMTLPRSQPVNEACGLPKSAASETVAEAFPAID